MLKKWKFWIIVAVIIILINASLAYCVYEASLAYYVYISDNKKEYRQDVVTWINECPKGFTLTKMFHYSMDRDGSSYSALLKCTNESQEQAVIVSQDDYICHGDNFHERYVAARECELDTGHTYQYCFAMATTKMCKEKNVEN